MNLVVALRDGVLKEPDGTMHRVVRGRTLADARHPAVVGNPQVWGPMQVHLNVDDDADASGEAAGERDELLKSLADATATAESYREQLAAVAEVLGARGLLPETGADVEGWLAEAVARAIDAPRPAPEPDAAPVRPPRSGAPRKRAAAKPAPDGGEDDDDDLA